MPLEDYLDVEQTEEMILARMLGNMPARYDKSEGGAIHDMQMPTALELAIADDRLRTVMDWGFAETTFGEWLDRRASEHGLTRRAATPAKGTVTITGVNGTVIPATTTEVTTETTEGVPAEVFRVDASATIAGGTATVTVTAVEGGAAGNVGAGQITLLGQPIAGVTGVTNAAAFTGGLDEETDDELLARYLQRVRNPGSSGNQADYINWALEVAGVGGAAVVPLEGGPGTVTVAIIDTNKRANNIATLVASVQSYIAPSGSGSGTGKAPIGAAVTIQAATEVAVALSATLTIESGYNVASVRAAAELAYEAYIKSLAFAVDNDVRIAKVISLLLDVPGVADATNVLLNGAATNVAISVKQIAIKGAVTWA